MTDPNPFDLPADVVDWVTGIFRQCNERLSEKLSNNPNIPEESLDTTWVEHFSQFATPLTLTSGWTVRIETHYLGGLRHFPDPEFFYRGWEVADIGVLLFVRRGGRVVGRKAALLQSKRLYPTNERVREEHRIDYAIGFAGLADPEILNSSIAVEIDFTFNDGCCFGCACRRVTSE